MPLMSVCAASALCLLLCSIALVHISWAMGGFWPGTDKASLKSKVVGGPPGQPFPSPLACIVVAGMAVLAAGLALALGGLEGWPPPATVSRLGWGASALFLLRGLLGLGMHRFSFWRESREFNDLNRRIYSPLCLLIASLFAGLAFRAF